MYVIEALWEDMDVDQKVETRNKYVAVCFYILHPFRLTIISILFNETQLPIIYIM